MKVAIEYGLGKNNLSLKSQKVAIDELGKYLKEKLNQEGIVVVDITSLINTQGTKIEEQKVVLLSNSYDVDFFVSINFENSKGVTEGAYCYSNSILGDEISKKILSNLEVGYGNFGIFAPIGDNLISKLRATSIIVNPFCSDSSNYLTILNGEFGYKFIAESITNAIKELLV